ncbi:MAG: signal recognition particle-docking protein FtsY [Gammaproteobacteria bacterium]|jgi:fused signal recognition particle receptor|nr:signal recognition particle-docking protein FtsY [Gammaproteobacteria bacterium]
MFGFIKRKQKNTPETAQSTAETQTSSEENVSELSLSLEKTRRTFADGMADFLLGKKNIDSELLETLETRLLSADVGIDATTTIIDELQNDISRKAITDADALHAKLATIMKDILQPCEQTLNTDTAKPFVILVVGINGAGKTTSIGKLANYFKQQGKSVMLAAGDTFRAAAVEQLQEWGQRNNVPVIAQGTGADPASVIFDAVQSASSKNIDIIIADTAGRLHTQDNLMDELAKIKRVLAKLDANAPHETMIVMDASFGQNALHQAQQFHESIGLTGMAVTKLDGTARGGILFSIARTLKLPVRFIGIGEGIDDLRPFNASEFVDALLE